MVKIMGYLFHFSRIYPTPYIELYTLITLLRVQYLCHFGSTSFVLPIRPKYGTLNRVIRVICHLNSHFVVKHLFKITEKITQTENLQLFDGIIDITSFDGVEGLDYWIQNFQFLFSWKIRLSPFLLVKYQIKIQILDRNSPVKS